MVVPRRLLLLVTPLLVAGVAAQPENRYKPHNRLSGPQLAAAQTLGYSPTSWNNPGENPIERLSFEELDDKQQDAALELGLDEDTYDCYLVSGSTGFTISACSFCYHRLTS